LPLSTDILDDLDRNGRRLDVLAAAGAIHIPWLIIHGSGDESVPASDAKDLAARAPDARLVLIAGALHTFGIKHPWSGSTTEFDRVLEASVDWFSRNLTS
jgi:pimeloyl-ACP methyl ester carboxylesterase